MQHAHLDGVSGMGWQDGQARQGDGGAQRLEGKSTLHMCFSNM
jgi:hypothetical protein